jgi:hypothetical protein
MFEHTTTECFRFPDIFDRPVVAKFDQLQAYCATNKLENRLGFRLENGCERTEIMPRSLLHLHGSTLRSLPLKAQHYGSFRPR